MRRDFSVTFTMNFKCGSKQPRDQEHFLDGLKRAGFLLPDNS